MKTKVDMREGGKEGGREGGSLAFSRHPFQCGLWKREGDI